MTETTGVSITEEQAEFMEKYGLSPSDLMRDKIDELMGETGELRHVLPTDEIIAFRNSNFLVAVLGAILMIISLTLWSFLGLANLYVPVIIEVVGAVVTVYGIYQIFTWENVLRERVG